MSFQLVETGGPMRNKPLSNLRVRALMAVDAALPLPKAVVTYILSLERAYLDQEARRNNEFLRTSWECRASDVPEAEEDGGL